ncbi:MAG: hypothetical protein R3E77_13635 [Steroidobacteraceae bacterium]
MSEALARNIRGGRPFFFADPAVDKLLNMTVTLASEVWVLRERLAALEAIGVEQGSLAAGAVDSYEFDAAAEARLGALRKEFIDSLFRILAEDIADASANSARARAAAGRRPGAFGARIAGLRAGPKRRQRPPGRKSSKTTRRGKVARRSRK